MVLSLERSFSRVHFPSSRLMITNERGVAGGTSLQWRGCSATGTERCLFALAGASIISGWETEGQSTQGPGSRASRVMADGER
jgi:hypothetical protein